MGTYHNLTRIERSKCEFCDITNICIVWIDLYDHTHTMCLNCINIAQHNIVFFNQKRTKNEVEKRVE